MKLFVYRCKTCQSKLQLNISAYSRGQLRQHFGGDFFHVTCNYCGSTNTYNVNEIFAESDSTSAISAGIIGGIIGLIGGPAGVAIGAGLGGLLGNNADTEEKNKVIFFNNSR